MTPDAMQQAYNEWCAWRREAGRPDLPSYEEQRGFEAGYNAARNGPSTPVSLRFKAICQPEGGGAPITAETVYNAYPRKVGKQAALKAIQKAVKAMSGKAIPAELMRELFKSHPLGATITGWDYLLNRTKAYADAVSRWPESERQYIPHPQTWFNQGRYDDDPKEWERGGQASQFGTTH